MEGIDLEGFYCNLIFMFIIKLLISIISYKHKTSTMIKTLNTDFSKNTDITTFMTWTMFGLFLQPRHYYFSQEKFHAKGFRRNERGETSFLVDCKPIIEF